MRCPKCGAFLDDGKEICFMCGANVRTYVPDNNGNNFNVDANFSSGNVNNNFSSNNRFVNNRTPQKETWKNVTADDEKDIFDFYEEHKKLIRIILIVILAAGLAFGGFKYYQYKTAPVPDTPVVGNLYYEVDSNFDDLSGSSSTSSKQYTLSGDKGSDCTISVSMATTTSENHVSEYFANVLETLEPSRDKEGNIENELDVYSSQEKNVAIQDVTWYSLNVYYRKDLDSDFNILKHKYLSIVHKGYSYDIALTNNANSSQCNLSLDNFVRSLKFIDE